METSTIEIDLEQLDKDQLINLIMYAHKYDITFNEAIVKSLTSFIEHAEEGRRDTDCL